MNPLPSFPRTLLHARSPLSRAEGVLCIALALATLLALVLPATGLSALYHVFADQRACGSLPNAADVLSNLPFALMGAWLWWLQHRWRIKAQNHGLSECSIHGLAICDNRRNTHTALNLLMVAAAGLLATAICSGIYHWAPSDAGLAIDRLGMSLAFAGVLSLATAERVSARAGRLLLVPLLLATVLSVFWAWRMNNMTPWSIVQGAGMLGLLTLCMRRPLPGMPGVHWLWVALAYALAKGLELADYEIFWLTHGQVSGHTLKHVVAAMAVLPIGMAVLRQLRQTR